MEKEIEKLWQEEMDKIQKSGVIPNFSYMHDVCMRLVSKSRQDTINEVLEKIDSWIESSKQFDKEWNKGYLAAMEQIRFELESEKEE
ncbi:MAG: hypothetical protein M0R80_17585 [Proteobacteria bacterium]|jgi:hypothetical protein|nr:hypothetical protein [Pseudomonadota bacterium]